MKHPPLNIAFELSNRCNYSHMHHLCPTIAGADPVFLKTKIITDAIDCVAKLGLNPGIYLNIYNEPMIDPRLFWILQYIHDHSDCETTLFTNGWGFNQYMLDELKNLEVKQIIISTYSDGEDERLRKMTGEGVMVQRIALDPSVMQIYDSPPAGKGPCLFPSIYPMVNHLGLMVLCCRDYEWREVLADLNSMSFEEALLSDKRVKTCDDLVEGKRDLDVCQRCNHIGWGVTAEEWEKWKAQQ